MNVTPQKTWHSIHNRHLIGTLRHITERGPGTLSGPIIDITEDLAPYGTLRPIDITEDLAPYRNVWNVSSVGRVSASANLAMVRRAPPWPSRDMRSPRWKAPPDAPAAYYHCISRVVDRQFLFHEPEREQFRRLLDEYSAFCGVRVLTWCILSNHFHLLIEIPSKPLEAPPLEQLLPRLENLSSSWLSAHAARQLVARWQAQGDSQSPERLRQRLWVQMLDLSHFMKLLKQRFSQWFNRTHQRRGTLWEERFKSVLIEGPGAALATVAAYLDLNPVRAGLVHDPKDYRWCGYAEALAGRAEARAGLATALGCGEDGVLAAYRQWLFGQGQERVETDAQGQPVCRGISRDALLAVLAQGGKLPTHELLRLRVRSLADGAILGSRLFVNTLFEHHRARFGPKRTSGARPVRGLSDLYALRALRLRVVE